MKSYKNRVKLVFLFLGHFSACPCQAQDSLNVEISGVVTDSHFKRPVVNARVEVFGWNGFSHSMMTDTVGRYTLRFVVPSDPDSAWVAIRCSSEEMYTVNDQARIRTNDTVIMRDYTLRWAGPCIDTFAPGYVHFDKGATCPTDNMEQYIKDWVPTALELTSGEVLLKVEILSSASYDERRHISRQRAACVRDLLLQAGLPDSVIVIEDLAQEPFYYCRNCEGCLPRFLYGTGDLLSRESIREAPNGIELNALRRMVHLAFVRRDASKVDRTAKPTLR
jgi:Carboxypeptidase regulatory-like domain